LAVSYLDRTDLAHVKPEGAAFDDIGRGEAEGVSNVRTPSENAASRSLEVLKQISSTGYLRKRMPQDLMALQTGVSSAALVSGTATMTAVVSETATTLSARDKAKMQGYEGEACGECGNYTLVRNGTCMKCNTCGGTSGCS
ncbi:MAG: vitamin B12-dependent ribonucleotide reductase, partial [Proteobacteria bacterium]|nr:vitamin B12-dependent ribonucleotide reductase [Pseudomonadota bacterium]